jgi:uncharacterized membrane protein SpoIIM required for sporulation
VIYRKPHNWRQRLRSLFQDEIPQVVRELRGQIQLVGLLFALSAGAGWWLVATYPELIGLVAGEEMINGVEGGRLWTEGILNVVPSSVLSVGILANNIAVSIFAFCVGVFFGLGTFYVIATNGLMLGGIFAFTHQPGMMLGESLIRPTHATRRESFRVAASKTSKLLLLCALLLVVCGFIEGYVSPDPDFPMLNRVIIGFGFAVVMLGALSGRLFGRRSGFSPTQESG